MSSYSDNLALGVRPATRITIVTDVAAHDLASARGIRQILTDAGYQVRVAWKGDWKWLSEAEAPDIIVLDTDTDFQSTEKLIRDIKEGSLLITSPILAVLPSRDINVARIWSALQFSGADDFIFQDALKPQVEARIELLARYSRSLRDLTAARDLLGKHQRLDDLTQLLNRRFFFQAAYHEAARARRYNHPLSCLMLDPDFLRLYQTMYGYACGEYILKTMANIIRQWTRDSDVVARFSEGKFVVLLPETPVQGAITLREKILKVIAETDWHWHEHKLTVSASIGEAQRRTGRPVESWADSEGVPPGEELITISVREETADLLADADAALSVAKKSARPPSFEEGERLVGILGLTEAGQAAHDKLAPATPRKMTPPPARAAKKKPGR